MVVTQSDHQSGDDLVHSIEAKVAQWPESSTVTYHADGSTPPRSRKAIVGTLQWENSNLGDKPKCGEIDTNFIMQNSIIKINEIYWSWYNKKRKEINLFRK